jgi:hypothetical protein
MSMQKKTGPGSYNQMYMKIKDLKVKRALNVLESNMQEFIYGLAVGKNFVTMIQKS